MTTTLKWTTNPDNMTSVYASGNFIPDARLMVLMRVPVWDEAVPPVFLDPEVNTVQNH
jgi:hypothetical protein